ncbi:NADH-quinone oxidoreductase subunit J [Jonesia quinghaiensis]|uniref:NADH-quinone oxidoreductase subunit J n=1 Tax=Jonesia quinghaiensis TaxID=262806 RepID=UPI00040A4FAD|nr:NADH-quinone oxidoreductase subunit J [Jonesia quinghaiensis]
MTSPAEAVLFWCLAPLMVLASLGLLFARKAVHATMSVVFVMICLAVLYIANEAPFLGIAQVVVYTGAIMMLFLFVIMLVGVDASDSLVETIRGQRYLGWMIGVGLTIVLLTFLARVSFDQGIGHSATVDQNPTAIARTLLGNYVFPLELVGILLVTAALAALTMTHQRRLHPRVSQKDLADARVAHGRRLTPLPSPGVFAGRNAMDVPALDPDGNPVESSVSRVLRARGQDQVAFVDPDIVQLTEAGESAPATWNRVNANTESAPEAAAPNDSVDKSTPEEQEK